MFNAIWKRLWRRAQDWWNRHRFRRLLKRLGLEGFLDEWNIAHVPFHLSDCKHNVVIVLDRDELQVDGVSGLVFERGKAPKASAYAFARRNGRLTGLRWSLQRVLGNECFCVGTRVRFSDVSLAMLRGQITAVVEELERCRLVLRSVEQHLGVRKSVWRS